MLGEIVKGSWGVVPAPCSSPAPSRDGLHGGGVATPHNQATANHTTDAFLGAAASPGEDGDLMEQLLSGVATSASKIWCELEPISLKAKTTDAP